MSQEDLKYNRTFKCNRSNDKEPINILSVIPGTPQLLKIDLRGQMPVVLDELHIASCVANTASALYQYHLMKLGSSKTFIPSRLFIYYNQRMLKNNTVNDTGASIVDAINVLKTFGVCREAMWPYDVNNFKIKPGQICYEEASKHKVLEAKKIAQTIEQLKQWLTEGYPIMFCALLYESFFENKGMSNGLILAPDISSEKLIGSHSFLICGYDNTMQAFLVRSSFGINYGIRGYFYFQYEYILNPTISYDFWTITKISDTENAYVNIPKIIPSHSPKNVYNNIPKNIQDVPIRPGTLTSESLTSELSEEDEINIPDDDFIKHYTKKERRQKSFYDPEQDDYRRAVNIYSQRNYREKTEDLQTNTSNIKKKPSQIDDIKFNNFKKNEETKKEIRLYSSREYQPTSDKNMVKHAKGNVTNVQLMNRYKKDDYSRDFKSEYRENTKKDYRDTYKETYKDINKKQEFPDDFHNQENQVSKIFQDLNLDYRELPYRKNESQKAQESYRHDYANAHVATILIRDNDQNDTNDTKKIIKQFRRNIYEAYLSNKQGGDNFECKSCNQINL